MGYAEGGVALASDAKHVSENGRLYSEPLNNGDRAANATVTAARQAAAVANCAWSTSFNTGLRDELLAGEIF